VFSLNFDMGSIVSSTFLGSIQCKVVKQLITGFYIFIHNTTITANLYGISESLQAFYLERSVSLNFDMQ